MAIYEKNNNDETIDPIFAKTLLMFANAMFYYNCKESI